MGLNLDLNIFKFKSMLILILILTSVFHISCSLDSSISRSKNNKTPAVDTSPGGGGGSGGGGGGSTNPGAFSISGVTGGSDVTVDAYLADGNKAEINWGASTGATSYDVAIYENDGSTVVCALQNTTSNSYDFSACPLTAGVYYRAKVTANDGTNSLVASNNSYRFLMYPTIEFSATSQSVAESAGTITITANLNAAIDEDLTFTYSLSGTATGSATDYDVQAGSGTPVTITAGQTTKNLIFTINDDVLSESSESLIVTLSSASLANLDTDVVHTVTITDNDLSVTVAKVYPLNGNWNDYIKFDNTGGGTNAYNQDDVACAGTETGYYGLINGCIHGGEKRKVVVTGFVSCTGLTISDSLGAFDWTCKVDAGTATFYTIGLKEGKGLADLVNATSWKNNSVTVQNSGNTIATSTSTTWGWGNTIVALPVNSASTVKILDGVDDDAGGTDQVYSEGTIFTLSADDTTAGYNVNMDRASIVTLGSAKLTWNGAATPSCAYLSGEVAGANQHAIVCGGTQKFIWIEGSFYGDSGSVAHESVYFESIKYSRFNKIKSTKSFYNAILLRNSNYNLMTDIKAFDHPNDEAFIKLGFSDYNRLINIKVAQSTLAAPGQGGHGIYIQESSNNIVFDVQVSQLVGSNSSGVFFGFYDNIVPNIDTRLSKVLVTGAQYAGIYVHSFGGIAPDQRHTLSHITIGNVKSYGFITQTNAGGHLTINQLVVANAGGDSIRLNGDSQKVSQSVFASSAGPSSYGIVLQAADNSMFTNNMIVGNLATLCEDGGSVNAGLDDSCNNQGTSNATWRTGASYSLASSFVGKVTSDDVTNTSDTNGTATYASISDWLNFDYLFRAWGLDGGVFPSTNNSGPCVSGTCRIWDWALKAADTIIRNTSNDGSAQNSAFVAGATCPAAVNGNKTLTDQMTVTNTYLFNATEIVTDEIGDEDGLCESNEACIYSPNFGYYQGEGNYLTAGSCTFQDGTVSGVTMYAYPINGR